MNHQVVDTGGMKEKYCPTCTWKTWWTLYNVYDICWVLVKQYYECQFCHNKERIK